jgi:cytochrome b subunit of formate dehydrogenase
MATSTLRVPSSRRFNFKTFVWIFLGLTTLFVFITSEVLLVTDYPMYHAYRLQVIADRGLLIPHTLAGTFALLAGPLQFSSRFRSRHLKLHRVLGRIYVISVFIGAATGIALAFGRPGFPGTCGQAAAWVVCTTAAFVTARNRHIIQHRQWMIRSYAVTFTFISSRVLNLWPRYWSHLGDTLSAVGVIAFTLISLLIVDIGLNWRELTTRRA